MPRMTPNAKDIIRIVEAVSKEPYFGWTDDFFRAFFLDGLPKSAGDLSQAELDRKYGKLIDAYMEWGGKATVTIPQGESVMGVFNHWKWNNRPAQYYCEYHKNDGDKLYIYYSTTPMPKEAMKKGRKSNSPYPGMSLSDIYKENSSFNTSSVIDNTVGIYKGEFDKYRQAVMPVVFEIANAKWDKLPQKKKDIIIASYNDDDLMEEGDELCYQLLDSIKREAKKRRIDIPSLQGNMEDDDTSLFELLFTLSSGRSYPLFLYQ